jgi:hypothetical protein
MYSPPIFDADEALGTLRILGMDTLPVASVGGGSRVLDPVTDLGSDCISDAGELGFRIDFSWNASRSELGERPPGEGLSYGERLVMLLPPIERADEYDPEVRMLSDDAAERVLLLVA